MLDVKLEVVTAIATIVIALATCATAVVYFLLWKQTKRSVDEMRSTTEFLIILEIMKKFGETERSEKLQKVFPEIAKKYLRRMV